MAIAITVMQVDRAESIEGVIQVVVCNDDELDATINNVKEQQADISKENGLALRWEDGSTNYHIGIGSLYEGWEYDPDEQDDEGSMVVALDVRHASLL